MQAIASLAWAGGVVALDLALGAPGHAVAAAGLGGLAAAWLAAVLAGRPASVRRRLLERVLAGTSDPIYVFDRAGRYRFASDAAGRALGLEPEAMVGRTWRELGFPAEAMEPFDRLRESVFATGRPARGETEFPLADGIHHYQYTIEPVFEDGEEAGEVAAVVVTAPDITEERADRRRVEALNAELAARTDALARANAELEAFSYTVSHDLRAPLRYIDGYIDLLQRKASDLDPKLRRYLDVIAGSAREMDALISDLLEYSRVQRADLAREPVDLAAIARRLVGRLRPRDREVEVRIGALPTVRGDARLLEQVLANLLENAFKFTSARERATVEVGARPAPGEVVVWVRDDGVGFDAAYAEKAFGLFERLHPRSEFPGTGVGLATVRHVVERHGGRAWADGAPGAGATVSFAIPDPTEDGEERADEAA